MKYFVLKARNNKRCVLIFSSLHLYVHTVNVRRKRLHVYLVCFRMNSYGLCTRILSKCIVISYNEKSYKGSKLFHQMNI